MKLKYYLYAFKVYEYALFICCFSIFALLKKTALVFAILFLSLSIDEYLIVVTSSK